MTLTAVLSAGAAAAAVLVTGWRWQPPPVRCRPGRHTGRPTGLDDEADSPRPGTQLGKPRRMGRPWRRSLPAGAIEIADWCGSLSVALRSGHTLTAAITDVTPPAALHEPVRSVGLDIRRGTSLAASMKRTAPDDHDARFAWTILTAVAQHGGAAAQPIDRAASALRARNAERVERQTQSTTARMSARVMTALPVIMLLLVLAMSPPVRAATLTPVGLTAVIVGLGLNLAGWTWMRRLVDRAAR